MYKWFRPFGRGPTPVKGLTNHGCSLLTKWDDPPSASFPQYCWTEIPGGGCFKPCIAHRLGYCLYWTTLPRFIVAAMKIYFGIPIRLQKSLVQGEPLLVLNVIAITREKVGLHAFLPATYFRPFTRGPCRSICNSEGGPPCVEEPASWNGNPGVLLITQKISFVNRGEVRKTIYVAGSHSGVSSPHRSMLQVWIAFGPGPVV